MSVLLPAAEAESIRASLTDYLTTTFAFADPAADDELRRLLTDTEQGIFRGPYVRLRAPFRAAADGWQQLLGWTPPHTPHAHQAEAWRRLSSRDLGDGTARGPHPTLVTTGTGSGKTEAFLYPILDHVMRAKAAGEGGVKALILYPMNALANDQARRLAHVITSTPQLAGIRAALYTGQQMADRTQVTPDSLITNREAIRDDAPDILLTNYKMLDQLLLRPADRGIWTQSANSLRYLVLDEFHTYDGAQGTDVAMLLRRVGTTLAREAGRTLDPRNPLGDVTPVATSATLGDKGDPSVMLDFAHTVFGVRFPDDSVVTETRLSIDEWAARHPLPAGAEHRELGPDRLDALLHAADISDPAKRARAVLRALYDDAPDNADPLALIAGHPALRRLAETATHTTRLDDLADTLIPRASDSRLDPAERATRRREVIVAVLSALSQVRATAGYGQALDVTLHLWVRELTRLDRHATPEVAFSWADDGDTPGSSGLPVPRFPAIYCRHCGRSGWGVQLAPTGDSLDRESVDPRAKRAQGDTRFRAAIHAPREAEAEPGTIDGLHRLDPIGRRLITGLGTAEPADDTMLPVLAITGAGAEDAATRDTCPSCGRDDGIRFVGSAIATMLSVAITTLFGEAALDPREKKALVFTDSVQDAAHRAGFIQSRAHTFGLRNAIRRAVPDAGTDLSTLVDLMMEQADTPSKRYLLLAPDIAHRDAFSAYWSDDERAARAPALQRKVRRRLLLDVGLEFGLQSRVGRTLEATGTLAAGVEAGSPAALLALARRAANDVMRQSELDIDDATDVSDETRLLWWVRGVLERMRDRGAIDHEWYRGYAGNDGNRWHIWGGRPKGQGMPAFPEGRDAPAWPRVGEALNADARKRSALDNAVGAQSWYAIWARDTLGVPAMIGAHLTRALLTELQRAELVVGVPTASGATAYALHPHHVHVRPIELDSWQSGAHALTCPVCENRVVGTHDVISQLDGAPCISARCPGSLHPQWQSDNFYRTLYAAGDMRRVVSREHTGLLADAVRLDYETKFKASDSTPDAPNVLVATPTLEMGIDIGDLSTVMLAGIPKTVANYLQRVGRAGRLTGNALNLAFVTGRGDQLPRLADPLSVIEGAVRAPATYLDAEEILQRQYIASIADRMAPDSGVTAPQKASDVLGSAQPGSYLGELVNRAETDHEALLGEFLAGFTTLDPRAVSALTEWARPTDGPGTSGVARLVYTAAQNWSKRRDELGHRFDEIDAALPDLKAKHDHPAAPDADKADYRSAASARRGILKQLAGMRDEYWISALESVGILPNYTLLDDIVQLDVSLTWFDPDTNQYEASSDTYTRGAGVAIREIVPGATFYAHGLEIAVDAVDLGIDGADVHDWQLCGSCGYANDIDASGTQVSACPRCGDTGIADVGQRMRIAPLHRVSAEVRRDEATIDDRRDERQRQQFQVVAVADIDPAGISTQWHADGTGFAARYCRELDIRWINLGPLAGGGLPRYIAGTELRAPLFRVCAHCGKLDRSTNANSRSEHRAWCPQRDSTQEQVHQIALMRQLRTQGLVIRVPVSVALDTGPALTSFTAAILLGLREAIGGDPDHLSVETIVDPDPTGSGAHATALLLHDTVPGGTGYLADLAEPERLRRILEIALAHLRDCPCADENRAACPRCLLPFAGRAARSVSRLSAIRTLAQLLETDGGAPREWDVRHETPPVVEAPLESRFRKILVARLQKLSASIVESIDDTGRRLTATLPGGQVWILREQVKLGATTPDFMLYRHGEPKHVAIYTDGFAYHASPAHNRIADDAAKRRWVRDQGHHVIAITWDDLAEAESGAQPEKPWWYDAVRAGQFGAMWELPAHALAHITRNPVDQLIEYIQNPGIVEVWGRIGAALPMLLWKPPATHHIPEGDAIAWTAGVLRGDESEPAREGAPSGLQVRDGAAIIGAHLRGLELDSALMLDDRPETLLSAGFIDQWKLWLRWSNVIGFAPQTANAWIGALSEAAEAEAPAAVADVPEAWAGLLAQATSDEASVLRALAADDLPVPRLGYETGDGLPLAISWPDKRIAIDLDLDDVDKTELDADGWMLVAADPDAIRTALEQTS